MIIRNAISLTQIWKGSYSSCRFVPNSMCSCRSRHPIIRSPWHLSCCRYALLTAWGTTYFRRHCLIYIFYLFSLSKFSMQLFAALIPSITDAWLPFWIISGELIPLETSIKISSTSFLLSICFVNSLEKNYLSAALFDLHILPFFAIALGYITNTVIGCFNCRHSNFQTSF